MSKVFIINKKHIALTAVVGLVVLFTVFFLRPERVLPSNAGMSEERVIHMVTGEFKSTTPEGKEIEAYRWDPGTIFVNKGENIKLVIYGVNGESHPFAIEGLNIKGEVKKGEETVVTFKADKAGIYRMICISHADSSHYGPMIGYIVVQ